MLPDEEERSDASAWRELVSSRGVTVWNSAPALLDVMLDDGPGAAAGLRLALVSGDWVPLGLRFEAARGGAARGHGRRDRGRHIVELLRGRGGRSVVEFDPLRQTLSNQSFRVVSKDGLNCPTGCPASCGSAGGSGRRVSGR